MKNKFLYNMQFATLIFFLINSFFLNVSYHVLTQTSNSDSIIDIIIGGIFIIIFLLIILWIRRIYNKDIIEIIYSFKFIKWPLLFIIIVILMVTTIYSLNNLVNFIHYYILKEVDTFTIAITLLFTCLYLIKKNLPTISRVSEICFYLYIIIMFLGIIGLLKYIDISNIKPLFTTTINQHLKTSFTFFNYSIFPIFLILGLKNKKEREKDNILIIIFTIISILTILSQAILIISVLGINLTNIYQYPDIIIYKKISFLNILERVEVFLSFNQLLNGIFLIVVSIYLVKKIIIVITKTKKESTILTLLGIIFLFLINTINIKKDTYLLINNITLIIVIIIFIRAIIYKYIHQILDQT